MSKLDKYLQLEQEIQIYKNLMSQASEAIRDNDVTNYPIFVMHQQQLEIGIVIADLEKNKGKWNINASSLEEFVAKNIVFDYKIEEFKKTYKSPDEYLCIFIVSELGTQFIYVPKEVSPPGPTIK